MKVLYWIFLIIILLSSVECFLRAWFNLDLVTKIFPDVVTTSVNTAGGETTLTAISKGTMIVYSLFGIAGIWVVIANLFGSKKA